MARTFEDAGSLHMLSQAATAVEEQEKNANDDDDQVLHSKENIPIMEKGLDASLAKLGKLTKNAKRSQSGARRASDSSGDSGDSDSDGENSGPPPFTLSEVIPLDSKRDMGARWFCKDTHQVLTVTKFLRNSSGQAVQDSGNFRVGKVSLTVDELSSLFGKAREIAVAGVKTMKTEKSRIKEIRKAEKADKKMGSGRRGGGFGRSKSWPGASRGGYYGGNGGGTRFY